VLRVSAVALLVVLAFCARGGGSTTDAKLAELLRRRDEVSASVIHTEKQSKAASPCLFVSQPLRNLCVYISVICHICVTSGPGRQVLAACPNPALRRLALFPPGTSPSALGAPSPSSSRAPLVGGGGGNGGVGGGGGGGGDGGGGGGGGGGGDDDVMAGDATIMARALAESMRAQQREEDAPFRTKAMREVDELEAKPVYG